MRGCKLVLRDGASRVGLAALAALAFVAIDAAPTHGQMQDQATIADGARVYGNMCGRCHNPRSPLERTDREWIAIINHMRIRGNLTGGQVRDALAFLQGTNSDPAGAVSGETRGGAPIGDLSGPPLLAQAPRGLELLTEKACVGCHLVNGRGGNIGPSLDNVANRRDIASLRRKLADPAFDNAASMMPNLNLTADEIEAIVAYLVQLAVEAAGDIEPGSVPDP